MRCQGRCSISELLLIPVPKGCGCVWGRPGHKGPTSANALLTITSDGFSFLFSFLLMVVHV